MDYSEMTLAKRSEMLLSLSDNLVRVITSDAIIRMQAQPGGCQISFNTACLSRKSGRESFQPRAVLRSPCEKAPDGCKATCRYDTGSQKTNTSDKPDQPADGKRPDMDGLTQNHDQPSRVSKLPLSNMPLSHCIKSSQVTAPNSPAGVMCFLLLKQQQYMAQGGSAQEEEKTAGDGDTGEVAADENVMETIQETRAASASNEAEKSRPVSPEITLQTALSHQEPPDATPVMPTKEVAAELLSPLREEIHREKIYMSLKSISSSWSSTIGSPSTELTSLRDTVLEAVRVVHGLSKYQEAVPKEVHSMILQSVQGDRKESAIMQGKAEWSRGSTWRSILEMGSSEQVGDNISSRGRSTLAKQKRHWKRGHSTEYCRFSPALTSARCFDHQPS
jgi:hypothetical protein